MCRYVKSWCILDLTFDLAVVNLTLNYIKPMSCKLSHVVMETWELWVGVLVFSVML